jgi:hypothetical protein
MVFPLSIVGAAWTVGQDAYGAVPGTGKPGIMPQNANQSKGLCQQFASLTASSSN